MHTVYACSLTGGLFANVPCNVVKHFRVRVIAAFIGLLVTQQVSAQVILRYFELLLSFFVRSSNNSVLVFSCDLLRCLDVDLQSRALLRQIFREFALDQGAHACHLVQTLETVYRRTAEASARRTGWSILVILSVIKDLVELVQFVRSNACESRVRR